MTVHQFKNGIEIHIPDEMQNQLEEWNNVKMIMDVLFGSPAKKETDLFAIFNTMWPPLKRRPKATARKSYHRVKKSGLFLK